MLRFGHILLTLVFAGSAFAAEPALRYDFTGDAVAVEGRFAKPAYTGTPAIADAGSGHALALDGAKAFLTVPGSGDLHLDGGGTLVATVKFLDHGMEGGQNDAHDMIFFKNNEFLLGRSQGLLYFNLKSRADWLPMATYAPLATGRWTEVTATVARKGEAYEVKLYIDGKPAQTKTYGGVAPDRNDEPVTIGRGWGGPWFLRGEIAEVLIFDQPLDAETLARRAADNPLLR